MDKKKSTETKAEEPKMSELDTLLEGFESAKTQMSNSLREISKMIQKEKEDLETEKQEWKKLENRLQTTQNSSRIKLDVGGTMFATSKSTLICEKGTYFEAMFGGIYSTSFLFFSFFITNTI